MSRWLAEISFGNRHLVVPRIVRGRHQVSEKDDRFVVATMGKHDSDVVLFRAKDGLRDA